MNNLARIEENPHTAIINLVLDSVDSEHTRRAYRRALVDFMLWYNQVAQPGLSKATVQRYRTYLRDVQKLSASSVNQRLSAIRKLALEASDNELMEASAANSIRQVKGVRQEGHRAGNWLSVEQAQLLLNAPDTSTVKGLRDRAALAVLLGCGLRRSEAAKLCWQHIQQREGRWLIVDLVGKRNKLRSVPMPLWCYRAIEEWASAAGLDRSDKAGRVFRAVGRAGQIGQSLTPQALRDLVAYYAAALGLGDIAPHDLRRTFAKLSLRGGSRLDQIQLSLGHASISTTQIYLGVEQDLADAPCDRLGLS